MRGESISLWIKLRDIALTLVAWIFLVYFMNDLWVIVFEYGKDIYLDIDPDNLVHWQSIWKRIAPFFYVAIFLIVWVVVLGSVRRRAIRKSGLIHGKESDRTVHQHFPLKQIDPAKYAPRFHVETLQLEQWQNMRTVDVVVDEQTHAKSITEVTLQ